MPDYIPREPETEREEEEASARTLAAVAQSERRYRRLFEAARDGILLLDVATGRISDANPFMSELLGYSHDELMGKELWEIGLFADREASRVSFLLLQENHYIRYEDLPLQTRSGEKREVEFVSNVYRENGHDVIQCNIRDITERKRLERALEEAFAREQHIAEFLQRPLTQEVAEDAFPGLSVATLYAPALAEAEVGGDFFDAFPLTSHDSENRIALVVGDVGGKGLVAAALAGRLKDVLRAFLRENADPAFTLGRLNDYLCDGVSSRSSGYGDTGIEPLVALAVVVIDSEKGTALFSTAGAEPPAVLRTDGTVEVVTAGGMMLGIQYNEVYENSKIFLEVGDTVLLVTDGITEARQGREFLGHEGMMELAKRYLPLESVQEMGRSILEEARTFAGAFKDDVCLLLVRRREE